MRLGVEEWRGIGFLSEAQPLYNWLTGEELLRFTRQLYPNWDTGFCDHLCRMLDLPLDRKVGRYSKGERMKFMLLLALSFHPRLLLLDEPFSGLDVVAKEQLISCLLEATDQEQWSVVFASHDLMEVERLADVIGLLDDGELKISEPLESLQSRFRKIQVFEAGAAPFVEASMLQAAETESGFSFIETAFSPEREQELQERFGAGMEITPLALRDIVLALLASELAPL